MLASKSNHCVGEDDESVNPHGPLELGSPGQVISSKTAIAPLQIPIRSSDRKRKKEGPENVQFHSCRESWLQKSCSEGRQISYKDTGKLLQVKENRE